MALVLAFLCMGLMTLPVCAQSDRIGPTGIKRADPRKSNLIREEGAIYLSDMFDEEMPIHITSPVRVFSDLKAERWIGDLFGDRPAVLLAVDEKAYRIRGQAKQGQIAGWISKTAVTGLPEGFEENLRAYHERFIVVSELIENHQVSLGMTMDEVLASLGNPAERQSISTTEGRQDSFDYIFYKKVPETFVAYDPMGVPYTATRMIEVESGRVSVEFIEGLVSAIAESQGISRSSARRDIVVSPPPGVF